MISARSVPAFDLKPTDVPSDGLFYTNRCSSCGRALTKLEILERLQEGPVCPCGSNRFKSTNFKLWEEILLPRSWRMWWHIRNGRLAPPPTPRDIESNRESMIRQVAELEEAEMPGEDV